MKAWEEISQYKSEGKLSDDPKIGTEYAHILETHDLDTDEFFVTVREKSSGRAYFMTFKGEPWPERIEDGKVFYRNGSLVVKTKNKGIREIWFYQDWKPNVS